MYISFYSNILVIVLMLVMSVLNSSSTTSSSLFSRQIRRRAPRKWRKFSCRYRAVVSILLTPNLAKITSHESCPAKTDSRNLLISRVPPGEKRRRWRRLRGNLRTSALENSRCMRMRKFREAILLLFLKRFSRSLTGARASKAEAILHVVIPDLCRARFAKTAF